MPTKSQVLFAKARRLMPGGVNSPVRAFRAVGGDPIFMASGKGATMTDVDGKSYIDYVLSWGPLILGHAHPEVVEALARRRKRAPVSAPALRGKWSWRSALWRPIPPSSACAW